MYTKLSKTHKQRQAYRAIIKGNRLDLSRFVREENYAEIRRHFPRFEEKLLYMEINTHGLEKYNHGYYSDKIIECIKNNGQLLTFYEICARLTQIDKVHITNALVRLCNQGKLDKTDVKNTNQSGKCEKVYGYYLL